MYTSIDDDTHTEKRFNSILQISPDLVPRGSEKVLSKWREHATPTCLFGGNARLGKTVDGLMMDGGYVL
jgi:hypothetical protein